MQLKRFVNDSRIDFTTSHKRKRTKKAEYCYPTPLKKRQSRNSSTNQRLMETLQSFLLFQIKAIKNR